MAAYRNPPVQCEQTIGELRCPNRATVIIGNTHLCQSCAESPAMQFVRRLQEEVQESDSDNREEDHECN